MFFPLWSMFLYTYDSDITPWDESNRKYRNLVKISRSMRNWPLSLLCFCFFFRMGLASSIKHGSMLAHPLRKLDVPRRALRTGKGMLTFRNTWSHSCFVKLKGVHGFQAFVLFVLVLFFSLFQICLLSLNYGLYWTKHIKTSL